MEHTSFNEFLRESFSSQNSGAFSSYIKAIKIMEEIFAKNDLFNLGQKPLSEIRDPHLITLIIDYILDEEYKYKKGLPSFFDSVKDGQKSYAKGGFCKAAIKKVGEYVNLNCRGEVTDLMGEYRHNGKKLSKRLSKRFHIDENGTEKEVRAKQRIGQDIFRNMLLEIYDSKCCLTGIEIPEVLRAGHIIPWSECKDETRLDPANGLCLSATYDAAFDRHLVSFDEDYRLILSPLLKEKYSSEAFKTYFLSFEGKQISFPSIFIPSQQFLSKHRDKLIT